MRRDDTLERIQLQILWDRLLAVVEEQAQTLVRTAFSTTVREAGDISAGVFDTRGRMLAQAVTGTPGHVNAMAASVGFFLQRFPVDTLHPEDVLLTNDTHQLASLTMTGGTLTFSNWTTRLTATTSSVVSSSRPKASSCPTGASLLELIVSVTVAISESARPSLTT